MIALYFQVIKQLRVQTEYLITLLKAPITNTNTTNLISVWEKAIFEWSKVQTNFPDFEINIMGDKVISYLISIINYLIILMH